MSWTAELLDLVLPRSCLGCCEAGQPLCPACRSLLRAAPLGVVQPCPRPAGVPTVSAAVAYEGAVRRLLVAHKERGCLQLTAPLAGALAAAIGVLDLGGAMLLCPVPSSAAAVRARGHDHAWRLARGAGRALGLPAARLLTPTRRVADQAGLSTVARARNLDGALRVTGPRPARPVVLIDDVMTTGATLREASRALRAGGHPVIGAAVLAATRRRGAGRSAAPWFPLPEGGNAV